MIPENENAGDSVENLGNGNETGANEGNEDKGSGDKEAAEEEKTELRPHHHHLFFLYISGKSQNFLPQYPSLFLLSF